MSRIKLHNADCLEQLKKMPDNCIDSIVTDPPYGISFMGKKWDYDVPSVEIWQEALRVLKPGGHILCACGTRTQHRMAVNLEDAGFEIRDIVAWVYGSGFPKSLNIGKAVDKLQGNEREDLGESTNNRDRTNHTYNSVGNVGSSARISKGNSPYEGWGTALKPAMELWTLARKPLAEKTIAKNVLKYGTGGINIDGCRVPTDEKMSKQQRGSNVFSETANGIQTGWNKPDYNGDYTPSNLGRFPANLIHDGSDEVLELFPETGSGSAARFFYCAKASKKERNAGCEGLPLKDKVFNGKSNKSSEDMKDVEKRFTTQPQSNNHPTVKPVALMRYLCRLITPANGVVLDPFMGSGSTGVACKELNRDFIGIEVVPEYYEIAQERIGD